MALTLDSIEKAIMDAVESYIHDAFLSGTSSDGSQVIPPMAQYGSEVMTKNGGEYQRLAKGPFKSGLAALLKALRSGVTLVSAYGTGWTAGDSAGYAQGVSYGRTVDGEIMVVGTAKCTVPSLNPTILTLPAGYRPALDVVLPVLTGALAAASVTVKSTGAIVFNGTPGMGILHLGRLGFRAA